MITSANNERSPEYYESRNKTNDKFIMLYGEPFMKVKAVPAILTSKTLKSAVERGDWLVVNMNTGDLTIYSKARQDRDKLESKTMFDATPRPVNFELIVNSKPYRLSSNIDAAKLAIVKLAKQIPLLGSTLQISQNGRSLSREHFTEGDSLLSFVMKVSKAYKSMD